MGALELTIHSKTPELRKIDKVVDALRNGAVILYPTDTTMSLGCELSNKEAIERIRLIRRMQPDHSLTFLCRSLSNISEFAQVSNNAYKFIKRMIPGPYTFILPASRNVPKFAQHPKRKTTGIRVPDNVISQLLLKQLDAPIITITAKFPDGQYISDPDELISRFSKLVDVAVKSDSYNFLGESTIIDMTTEEFRLIREGAGAAKAIEFL